MGLYGASTYAPDDAARDDNGQMITITSSVDQPSPEHPGVAAVRAPLSRWIALGLLVAFGLWWSKRK